MQCNTALLEALVQDYGGAGWLLIEADRLICLNLVLANPSATPGFKRGEGMAFPQSAIPAGLAQRGNGFISEADGSRVTAMLPLRNRRDHDLGWIGLTLAADAHRPCLQDLQERLERFL